MLLFNFVKYIFLWLCVCILIVMYAPFWVFCFIVLFCSLIWCNSVPYYCHRVSCQFQVTNISSYHIISYHKQNHLFTTITSYTLPISNAGSPLDLQIILKLRPMALLINPHLCATRRVMNHVLVTARTRFGVYRQRLQGAPVKLLVNSPQHVKRL